MSNTAQEEWKALNRAVNCKHYIGARRWAVINDALTVGSESASKGDKKTPTPTIKTPVKTAPKPAAKPTATAK